MDLLLLMEMKKSVTKPNGGSKKKSVNTRKRVHFYNTELKVIIATKAIDFPIKRQRKVFRDVGRFENKEGEE